MGRKRHFCVVGIKLNHENLCHQVGGEPVGRCWRARQCPLSPLALSQPNLKRAPSRAPSLCSRRPQISSCSLRRLSSCRASPSGCRRRRARAEVSSDGAPWSGASLGRRGGVAARGRCGAGWGAVRRCRAASRWSRGACSRARGSRPAPRGRGAGGARPRVFSQRFF